MSDTVANLQAQADGAWGEHEAARAPMRTELLDVLRNLEGVTGLTAGPGSERLADAILDFGEYHADQLADAYAARAAALDAQGQRDTAIAAEPAETPAAVPSLLETAEPLEVREWLKGANDADVLRVLSEVSERGKQLEWAHQLQSWARADGNVAMVFAAINSVIVPSNPAEIPDGGTTGGTGGTSSYRGSGQIPESASADDAPTGREAASDVYPATGSVDEVLAWVNHGADNTEDLARARQAYEAEAGSQSPRNDVLLALVEILDQGGNVTTVPNETPAPDPAPDPESTGDTQPTT